VNPGSARQHVVDETLVTRDIDKAEGFGPRHWAIGEAEINGYAARLLRRQPGGIDTSQRTHQCRLTVINMAGGADYHAGSRRSADAGEKEGVGHGSAPIGAVDQDIELETGQIVGEGFGRRVLLGVDDLGASMSADPHAGQKRR
jgi:hypothetical protein